jgi:hypothetical protein
MQTTLPTFSMTVIKTAITHSVTYFLMGLLASTLLDYSTWFAESSLNLTMRQLDDPWVMAGPLLQPIRGIVFGVVFYLLRDSFFAQKNGWLLMWITLVAIGIIGTFGPTPGSLEGMIYTTYPLALHLRGLPEVILQSLLLSWVLYYWVNHPQQAWLNWVIGIAFVIVIALPALGLLMLGAS